MLPRPKPTVIFKPVSEGAVLLDTESEVYFGLNQVGAQVWELIGDRSLDLSGIMARLCERYPDAPPDVLEKDVMEMLGDLESNGLVAREAATDGDPEPSA